MASPVFKTALSRLVRDGRFDSFPSPPYSGIGPERRAARHGGAEILPHEDLEARDASALDGRDVDAMALEPPTPDERAEDARA